MRLTALSILLQFTAVIIVVPNKACGAIQAGALAYIQGPGFASLERRGETTAEVSAAVSFPYFNIPNGRGGALATANVDAASTERFLRTFVDVTLFDDGGGGAGAGAHAEAFWQDMFHVSGPAAGAVRMSLSVDAKLTFVDFTGPTNNRAFIDLYVTPTAGLFTNPQFPTPPGLGDRSWYLAGADSYRSDTLAWDQVQFVGYWDTYSFTTDPLNSNVVHFHGERSLTFSPFNGLPQNTYAYWTSFRVRAGASRGRVIADGSHSASILSVTDPQGNDLRDRVTFASGMQFPSATPAVPEPASLLLWSLGIVGLAATRHRRLMSRAGTFANAVSG